MPRKNAVKPYIENGTYHIYNRGVEKRTIFMDEKDYRVFLSYLKEYLSAPPEPFTKKQRFTLKGSTFEGIPRQPNNYFNEVDLLAFCLMPNHYHLLIRQSSKNTIKEFMRSVGTRYTMYFNKRHDRVGALFQGTYKAVLVENDSYLLHLSRYIHLNPLKFTNNIKDAYSSYSYYLGLNNANWVKPKLILDFFKRNQDESFIKSNDYRLFVEDGGQKSEYILGDLVLE